MGSVDRFGLAEQRIVFVVTSPEGCEFITPRIENAIREVICLLKDPEGGSIWIERREMTKTALDVLPEFDGW